MTHSSKELHLKQPKRITQNKLIRHNSQMNRKVKKSGKLISHLTMMKKRKQEDKMKIIMKNSINF